MDDKEEELFMLHLDDNVFDPITRKEQEAVYDQFYNLMLSLDENFSKEFSPYYSIASFFERIGKGNLWDEVNIYEGIETDKLDYYNGESLANDIDRISVKIVENFQKSCLAHIFYGIA